MDGGHSHAGRQPARWEQWGWGVLLRDTPTLTRDRISNLPVTSQPEADQSYTEPREPGRTGNSTPPTPLWAPATIIPES